MPSNFTEHYNLSQWERTDKIQMEDFNTDNAKIDGALAALAAADGAEANARKALESALNRKGNCSIGAFTYTGNGKYGQDNPTVVKFPQMPIMYVILGSKLMIGRGGAANANIAYSVSSGGTSIGSFNTYWSGSTMSLWDSKFPDRQMNESSVVYQVIAFYAL